MRYEDVVRDFALRTQANLRAIERLRAQGEEVYEATQLINSTLGLLVFPREEYVDRIPAIPLAELRAQGWPVPDVTPNFKQVKDLRELARYLRNAISHFNVAFPADGTNELRLLRVWNTDPRSRTKTWEAVLTLEDLRELTHRFADLLISDVCVKDSAR